MARVKHPFNTATEMFNTLGWPPGKWKPIPVAIHGSLQGLPDVSGIPVADNEKGHILLLRDNHTLFECCKSNFIPTPNEDGDTTPSPAKPRINPRIARYI